MKPTCVDAMHPVDSSHSATYIFTCLPIHLPTLPLAFALNISERAPSASSNEFREISNEKSIWHKTGRNPEPIWCSGNIALKSSNSLSRTGCTFFTSTPSIDGGGRGRNFPVGCFGYLLFFPIRRAGCLIVFSKLARFEKVWLKYGQHIRMANAFPLNSTIKFVGNSSMAIHRRPSIGRQNSHADN